MAGSAYDWSPTAASNTATPPNGAPAGMTGSQCEPLFRQMMAATADLARSIAAGGTSDAITATLPNAPSALVDGMEVRVRAASANTTTAPTFQINGLSSPYVITKMGGQALAVGDIAGAAHEMLLRLNTGASHWELLNPQSPKTITGAAISGGSIDNATIGATTASSAKVTTLDASGAVTFHSGGTFTGTFSGGTFSGATLSGTTTNSGTISGGTVSGATVSGATLSGTTTNSGTISGGTVSGATVSNPTFSGTASGGLALGSFNKLTPSSALLSVENDSGLAAQFMNNTAGGSSVNVRVDNTGAGFVGFLYGTSSVGSITTSGSTTAYNTSSDQRIKTNIVDAPYDPTWIGKVPVRQFEFVAQPGAKNIGAIAQELAAVSPEAVTPGDANVNLKPGDDGFIMWGVDEGKQIWRLIQEVQQLRLRVAALDGKG